ncbi:MAG: hypothetical protein ABFD83_04665 [Armatimonadota bacterium]
MDGLDSAPDIISSKETASKQPSFRRSAVLTGLTQGSVAVATLLHYWLIRWHWSVDDLGGYTQLMRVRGILQWVVLLQLPIALARELGASLSDSSQESRRSLTWTGLSLGTLLVAVFSLAMVAFPRQSAYLMFGNAHMQAWVLPFVWLLSGNALCSLIGSAARGLMSFHITNLVQFVSAVIVPTVLLLTAGHYSMQFVVGAIGVLSTMTAVVFTVVLWQTRQEDAAPLFACAREQWRIAKQLLMFGVPRLSTLVCVALLNLAVPWLISKNGDLHLLAAANTLLGVISSITIVVAPLGFVLLPHLSNLLTNGHRSEAGRIMSITMEFSLVIGGLGSLAAMGLLQIALHAWLGSEVASYTPMVIACAIALPGSLVLEMLRSPLDAASRVPWNSVMYGSGAIASLAAFFCLRDVGFSLSVSAAWSLGIGYIVSALVGSLIGYRCYDMEFSAKRVLPALAVWCAGTAILIPMHYNHSLALQAIVTAVFMTAYVGVIFVTRPPWLERLLPGRIALRLYPGGAKQ